MSIKALLPLPVRHAVRATRRFLRGVRYLGARFHCPMCGWSFRRLLPLGVDLPVLVEHHVIGGGYREHAECPRCGSTDRERLLYLYLQGHTTVFQGNLSVLHLSPEPALRAALSRSANGGYVTTDLAAGDVDLQMDVTSIPFPTGSFDVVICSHVLEHVPDDHRAMRELCRVLKLNGWAILQIPISATLRTTDEDAAVTSPEDRLRRFGQRDHVRIYGADWPQRLAAAGFSVYAYSLSAAVGPQQSRRYGLLDEERVFVCSKHGVSSWKGGDSDGSRHPVCPA